jgi:tripartite ATP-independent transporter DctP family solute receptor
MKNHLLPLIVFGFLVACSSCSSSNDKTILKLAHSLNNKHPVHQAIEHMAKRLHELSGGSMRVDIYPSGQLGSEREMMELLQIGSLAMTKVSSSPMEAFVPEMKIFSLPYVFRDSDHFWQVLNGPIGRELLLSGASVHLRGLAYYDAGSRSFYTVDRDIHQPKDLNGLKIRVQQSQTAMEMVSALGGSPTPISWGELYTALQQGVVDGAENNLPSFYSSKHYEVAKYFTLDEHTRVPDMLIVSQYIWTHLSTQEQKWLQQAVDESVVFQRKLWAEATDEALVAVQKAGVKIISPDKSLFEGQVQEMHDKLTGTEVYALLQKIRDLK